MKHIAIIGGTGSTGKEVVRQAVERGYKVTIVTRSRNGITDLGENVKFVNGDVTNAESLAKALVDIDVVISCFGPVSHRKVGNLMSTGTINIVNACQALGIKRLVFMSGFVQSDGKEFSLVNKLILKLLHSYYHMSYKDKTIAESAIEKSTLDWVIVRASALMHAKATGQYKAGIKIRLSPFAPLSYADCALCLLDAVEKKQWTKQVINVGKK